MNLALIGTGSAGLVTGACLAEAGHHVTCVDPEARWSRALPAGERDLAELVRRNVWEQRLSFTPSVADAMRETEVVFVAAGAAPEEDAERALRSLVALAGEAARHATRDTVVVLRATGPVGTAEKVAEAIRGVSPFELDVVSNPDFLDEGAAVDGFLCPDRVVVGVTSERARAVMERLYAPFLRRDSRLVFMDPRSAELTAHAAAALRAARDTLMDEVAATCDRLGADLEQVRRGLLLGR